MKEVLVNSSELFSILSLSKTVHTLERYQGGMTRHANLLQDDSRIPPRCGSSLPIATHCPQEAAVIKAGHRCLHFSVLSSSNASHFGSVHPPREALTGVSAANLRKSGFTPKIPAAKESNWGAPMPPIFPLF